MNSTGDDDPIDRATDLYWDYVQSEDNEILVAINDQDRVLEALQELGIQELPDDRKTSERLGLTLLSFEKLADPVEASLPRVEGARPDDLVGRVLSAIKGKISEGEPPTIGRNRLVGHVDGTNGNVIVKDANDPQPVNPKEFRPAPPTVNPTTQGGEAQPAIRVAIVDTELRPHPKLSPSVITPPVPFEEGKRYPYRAGHGTFGERASPG